MASDASSRLGKVAWWQSPIAPLGVGAAVFVVALLFGIDRMEAAWHGSNAAAWTLALLLLVLRHPGPLARVAIAIPVFLLLTITRLAFGSDLAAALWSAFLTTIVFYGLGAARRRVAHDDAERVDVALRRRRPQGAGGER